MVAFFLSVVSEVTVPENSKQTFKTNTSLGWKSNCLETPYKILDSYF